MITKMENLCQAWNSATENGQSVPDDNQYSYSEHQIVWDENKRPSAVSSLSLPLF